jgi:hypothetical protein
MKDHSPWGLRPDTTLSSTQAARLLGVGFLAASARPDARAPSDPAFCVFSCHRGPTRHEQERTCHPWTSVPSHHSKTIAADECTKLLIPGDK